MASLTYLKSAVSRWFLHGNPALRNFYMKRLRPFYMNTMARREEVQWRKLGISMLTPAEVRLKIAEALKTGTPFGVAKIGANEFFLLRWWMGEPVMESRLDDLHYSAGVFPRDIEFFKTFGATFAKGVKALDLLGLWTGKDEPSFYQKLGLKSAITSYPNFAGDFAKIAVGTGDTWFGEMKGYRVMVVSSFADLINQRANESDWNQYWNGRIPWPSPAKIEAVSFPYGFEKGTQDKYRDSIDLLEKFQTEHQAALEDSDIILLGCGAYAIPLVDWARRHGKVAIHMGGDIQLLFGIKGGRWDEIPGLYNEYWVRPGASLTPAAAVNVENSCYW